MLIFSDGLTEAADRNNEEFGPERLMRALRLGGQKNSPTELVNLLGGQIRQHSDGQLTDDLTILAIRGLTVSRAEAAQASTLYTACGKQ
jgi:serine phosphatase RsbU (regulator of sigma subunit)